ncbi:hypothetical protein F4820DRAFT_277989 [Hypoxylon rubiginosum]|uniref:Uncharacterized protein n=1 Tax=Hypoxylon rubiginosum TaxID=110542 RepID=A0ACB9Z3M1_9PEZI|nr:hypothetical protein F4820DRAFT_277989 [Hypoxylon rubiginosum]
MAFSSQPWRWGRISTVANGSEFFCLFVFSFSPLLNAIYEYYGGLLWYNSFRELRRASNQKRFPAASSPVVSPWCARYQDYILATSSICTLYPICNVHIRLLITLNFPPAENTNTPASTASAGERIRYERPFSMVGVHRKKRASIPYDARAHLKHINLLANSFARRLLEWAKGMRESWHVYLDRQTR